MTKQFVQTIKESDDPSDWLATSLILAKAIGHLLDDEEGVCIKPTNEIIKFTDAPFLLVYKKNDQIKIEEYYEELDDGQMIYVHSEFLH